MARTNTVPDGAAGEAGHRQAVVLLHGSACSVGQWRKPAAELSLPFRVFTPDLYAHGARFAWLQPGHPPLGDEATSVAELADRLGEPIHLVGHSS
jgi:pimeloyl-ACP methyl ester carboxylesterase